MPARSPWELSSGGISVAPAMEVRMGRPAGEVKRELKRVQMDMPAKTVERLKRLMKETEATSYAEVVRNALRLYEALFKEVSSGNEIMIRRDGKVEPYPILALDP